MECVLCEKPCVCISDDPESEDSLWECVNPNCLEDYEKNKKQDILYVEKTFGVSVEFFKCEEDHVIGLTVDTDSGECWDVFLDKAKLLAALK